METAASVIWKVKCAGRSRWPRSAQDQHQGPPGPLQGMLAAEAPALSTGLARDSAPSGLLGLASLGPARPPVHRPGLRSPLPTLSPPLRLRPGTHPRTCRGHLQPLLPGARAFRGEDAAEARQLQPLTPAGLLGGRLMFQTTKSEEEGRHMRPWPGHTRNSWR